MPPHSEAAAQKSRSLERNTPANLTYATRISSLERVQNAAKQTRSNSLTRQLSSGSNENSIGNGNPAVYSLASRSASLERGGRIGTGIYSCRTNSLERNNQQMIQSAQNDGGPNRSGGSLERNQSIASTYDLMKMRGYRGGSLERNNQGIALVGRSASLERNTQYQAYREQFKQQQQQHQQQATLEPEPFQEEIYDFGGANVKSCASIALNKSISKGLIPPGTKLPAMQQPQQCVPLTGKNMNLPPPTPPPTHAYQPNYIAQSYSIASVMQTQPIQPNVAAHMTSPLPQHEPNIAESSSVYVHNSIYTPMYPRIWTNASPPSTGTSHIVYVQQPQPTINMVMQQQQQQHQPHQNQSEIANYAHSSQLISSQMLNAQSIQTQNLDGVTDNGLAVQVCSI